MRKTRPYSDFTAQGPNVRSLMRLIGHIERGTEKDPDIAPIAVFLAFAIESYLNSLGARHIDIWDEIERLSWRSKMDILHKTAGRPAEWGAEPLQFATEVFKIRDKLAHGKPERVIGPEMSEEECLDHVRSLSLRPDWYANLTVEWALKSKSRFRHLMIYLAEMFGLPESDHLHMSSGGIIRED